MIITIDGPAGVGKSTVARIVADKLNLPYLNTGAMFRFLASKIKDSDQLSPEELRKECAKFHFSLQGVGAATKLLCNGEPESDELRSEETGAAASRLALRQEAREMLLQAQRDMGARNDLVAEGRDMGTKIFPAATYKFFLDADTGARAKRRWLELAQMGQDTDLAAIEKAIRERDQQDRNRPIAPLKPASDAIIIDTSQKSISEVVELILAKAL